MLLIKCELLQDWDAQPAMEARYQTGCTQYMPRQRRRMLDHSAPPRSDNVRHRHQIASGIVGITDKHDLQALLASPSLLVCRDIQSELVIQRHRLHRHPVSLRDKLVHGIGRTLNSNSVLMRLAIGPDQQVNRFISPAHRQHVVRSTDA